MVLNLKTKNERIVRPVKIKRIRIEWVFIWDSAAGSWVVLKNSECTPTNSRLLLTWLFLLFGQPLSYKYRKDSGEQRVQSGISIFAWVQCFVDSQCCKVHSSCFLSIETNGAVNTNELELIARLLYYSSPYANHGSL